MKTAASSSSLALLAACCIQSAAAASWNLSMDADCRYRITGWREHEAAVKVAGASLRKTFSDSRGDRLVLSGLVEAEQNFSEIMIHEMYARYKGPMGTWNVTAGRFGVPYGLLTGFSTTRLLLRGVDEITVGFDADNGIMVSGTKSLADYAIAVTQGYGPHIDPDFGGRGLGSGRFGLTVGESEEAALGLSGLYGYSASGRDPAVTEKRMMAAADITHYWGRMVMRLEASAGRAGGADLVAGFVSVDVALLPKLELNHGVRMVRLASTHERVLFSGFTFKPGWLTIRGGYLYEYDGTPNNIAALQIYRLFSWNF